MLQKLTILILLILNLKVKSQNTDESLAIEGHSISAQLYTKCFENLNQGSEIFEKHPAFKDAKLCSIAYCMQLLAYPEKDIQLAAESRLIGITTQLYNEGNPVLLIMGFESYLTAKERNENLEDDNHIVYISYGECTNPEFLRRAAVIVNKQTMQLIKRSSLK